MYRYNEINTHTRYTHEYAHLRTYKHTHLCAADENQRSQLDPHVHEASVHVTNALIPFCNHLAHTKHLRKPEWLYALPLIHFLQQECIPFEKPLKNSDKIVWEESKLDLARLRERTAVKTNIGYVRT